MEGMGCTGVVTSGEKADAGARGIAILCWETGGYDAEEDP